MPSKEVIHSDKAPKAIGPYSVAVRVGDFVFTAGQGGIDPQTGELVPGGITAETRQVLMNIRNVLEAAGCQLSDVVKTTVFMQDLREFSIMNSIYAEFFPANPPARSTVQVAGIPKGGLVEIEAVAVFKR